MYNAALRRPGSSGRPTVRIAGSPSRGNARRTRSGRGSQPQGRHREPLAGRHGRQVADTEAAPLIVVAGRCRAADVRGRVPSHVTVLYAGSWSFTRRAVTARESGGAPFRRPNPGTPWVRPQGGAA